jgi:hypothetical protein
MVSERFERQARLREVGAEGQARLERASFEVHGRDGALVELLYLCRSGAERVQMLPGLEPEAFAHAAEFRFEEARRVAAGAWRALAKIRGCLGLDEA